MINSAPLLDKLRRDAENTSSIEDRIKDLARYQLDDFSNAPSDDEEFEAYLKREYPHTDPEDLGWWKREFIDMGNYLCKLGHPQVEEYQRLTLGCVYGRVLTEKDTERLQTMHKSLAENPHGKW